MKEIIALILPLIGVFLGLLWSEISRWFADRRLKRQIVNKFISLLLELYYQIKRISFTVQQSSLIAELFADIKGKELTKDEEQVVNTLLSKTLYPIITESVSNDIDKINADYDSLLKDLSGYYPIDAYRLRGRNNIKNLLLIVDTYYKGIHDNLPIDYNTVNEIIANLKPILQSEAIQSQLSVIEEEIETLSKNLSLYDRKTIEKALKGLKVDNNEDFKKRLEDIKQIIIEQLKSEFL